MVANRVGKESFAPLDREGEVIFCGASCILSLKDPALLGLLDTEKEVWSYPHQCLTDHMNVRKFENT